MKRIQIKALCYRMEYQRRILFNSLAENYNIDSIVYSLQEKHDIGPAEYKFTYVEPLCKKPLIWKSRLFRTQIFISFDMSMAKYLFEKPHPDMVFILGDMPLSAQAAKWAAKKLKCPILSLMTIRPLEHEKNRNYFIKQLKRMSFSFCDGILASGLLAEKCLKYYGVPDSKIFSYHHFVDTEYFAKWLKIGRREREQTRKSIGIKDNLCIAFSGTTYTLKGIRDLLKAVLLLKNKLPSNFPMPHLLIIGGPHKEGGSNEYMYIKEFIKLNRIDATITGWVTRDKVAKYLSASDVYVLPSHWETWPKAIMEAMLAELPVIVTDACGCVGTLIKNNETGLVIPVKSPEVLCDAIKELLLSKEKRNKIVKAGLNAVKDYSPEKANEKVAYAIRTIYERYCAH